MSAEPVTLDSPARGAREVEDDRVIFGRDAIAREGDT